MIYRISFIQQTVRGNKILMQQSCLQMKKYCWATNSTVKYYSFVYDRTNKTLFLTSKEMK